MTVMDWLVGVPLLLIVVVLGLWGLSMWVILPLRGIWEGLWQVGRLVRDPKLPVKWNARRREAARIEKEKRDAFFRPDAVAAREERYAQERARTAELYAAYRERRGA